jgi:hypothetical protein
VPGDNEYNIYNDIFFDGMPYMKNPNNGKMLPPPFLGTAGGDANHLSFLLILPSLVKAVLHSLET